MCVCVYLKNKKRWKGNNKSLKMNIETWIMKIAEYNFEDKNIRNKMLDKMNIRNLEL